MLLYQLSLVNLHLGLPRACFASSTPNLYLNKLSKIYNKVPRFIKKFFLKFDEQAWNLSANHKSDFIAEASIKGLNKRKNQKYFTRIRVANIRLTI